MAVRSCRRAKTRGLVLPLVVAVVAFALARGAGAVPVGTGSLELVVDESGPPPRPMTGTIVFDTATYDLFGTPVDLGTDVGQAHIVHPPSAVLGFYDTVPQPSGTFIGRAESSSSGVFIAEGSGSFTAEALQLSSARLDSLTGTLPGTWPAGLTYRTDSKYACCVNPSCVPPVLPDTTRCTGIWVMNAFDSVPTPANPDPGPITTSASFLDVQSEQVEQVTVDVDFSSVATAGTTTLEGASIGTGNFAGMFSLATGGFRAVFFELSTTAAFSGPVEVCVHYADVNQDGLVDGTTVDERALTLLRRNGLDYESTADARVETDSNRVCGSVTSLSAFAVVVGPATPGPCPESICGCLGAAAGFAAVAADRVVLQGTRVKGTPSVSGDVCAGSRIEANVRWLFPIHTNDLVTLAATPRATGVKLRGFSSIVQVEGDVATAGGRVVQLGGPHEITGVTDTTGSHPLIDPCEQAIASMGTASATLAGLSPTRQLGQIRLEPGQLTLTADPGVNVWNATDIRLRSKDPGPDGILTLQLDPATESVVINTGGLKMRYYSQILVVPPEGRVKVVINVPGPGRAVKAHGVIEPMLLAPGRSVRLRTSSSNTFGRRIYENALSIQASCPVP